MAKKKKHSAFQLAQTDTLLPQTLHQLLEKRTGGAINIRGLEFQFLYASYLLLENLSVQHSGSIHLEGLEDIDLNLGSDKQLIQVKTSQNKMDASTFWDLNVLQNFVKVFLQAPNAHFTFVHNTSFAPGMMEELVSKKLSPKGQKHWSEKLSMLDSYQLEAFLKQIAFVKSDTEYLEKKIVQILFEKYQVNKGSEVAFLRALFYNVFIWSKDRAVVTHELIAHMLQAVRDSFGKFPQNPAIQNSWIKAVDFTYDEQEGDLGFYEGKAARPVDVGKGLPVRRQIWEQEIQNRIDKYDVTIIRSSSGQGKSTLAWMVSQTLQQRDHAIYQIVHCPSHDESQGINDFIESRLLIGQVPVVVVDGLNQSTSSWFAVAENFRGKPIKFIITTREEDWVRYGNEVTSLSFNTLEIRLQENEAKSIYASLREHGKVHTGITTWEPIWEKVKDKGLLIEYVYLLTQGQMIEERLIQQVNTIKSEPNSVAKFEILRMISLADVLSIKIKTRTLTHLLSNIPMTIDRNEIYRELEKEYYLKFGDRFIEGLHPVRSNHLQKILHSHLAVDESLIKLLKLIEEEYVYEFFISSPLYFQLSDDFYKDAAEVMATRSFPEMVYAIDGLMHFEPYNYWRINKNIFDEVHERLGLYLFITENLPMGGHSIIQGFIDSVGDERGNLNYLMQQSNKLIAYSFTDSSVHRFSKYLNNELSKKPKFVKLEGVDFLYRWFNALNLSFPDIVDINEDSILHLVANNSIDHSSSLFNFFHLHASERIDKFTRSYRDELIGWIKKKTNTLTIEEVDEDIHINFLLDANTDKINEQSVYRINMVRAFFPYYKTYCTEAIVLPYPSEQIIKAVKDLSRKTIQPKNLGDEFIIHVNKIWIKVIEEQYGAKSMYDWQKNHLLLKEKGIEVAKKCVRLMEGLFEKKQQQITVAAKEFDALSREFLKLDTVRLTFPSHSRKYFDVMPFQSELDKIRKFNSSFVNYINQFSGLISPTGNNDQNLAVFNIKDAVNLLAPMQEAYKRILNGTQRYFDTEELDQKEATILKRLSETSQFYQYYYQQTVKETVVRTESSISSWMGYKKRKTVEHIRDIITEYSKDSPWNLIAPTDIIEADNIKYATIILQGLDFSNEQDTTDLLIGLINLYTSEVHFFYLLLADQDDMVYAGFRISQSYFEQLKNLLDGTEDSDDIFHPIPIDLSEITIQLPLGFKQKIEKIEVSHVYFQMMFNVWKLSEYRSRLQGIGKSEGEWLKEIEIEYNHLIMNDCKKLNELQYNVSFVKDFIDNRIILSQLEIIELMNSHVTTLTA